MARPAPAIAPHTLPCTRCKERKPIQAFARWSRGVGRGGFYSLCLECDRARAKEVWDRRKERAVVVTPDVKPCPSCRETKDASAFSPNPGASTGLSSWCKRCVADLAVRRYATIPEARERVAEHGRSPARRESKKAYNEVYNAERQPEKRREYDQRNREVIANELEERGGVCARCGEPFAGGGLALQWHHRDPATKLFDIGSATSSVGVERLRDELEKCDPLHSSCHKATHREMRKRALVARA